MLRQCWMAAAVFGCFMAGAVATLPGCGPTQVDPPDRLEASDGGGGPTGGPDDGGVEEEEEPIEELPEDPPEPVGPGPWPTDAQLNYSAKYGLGPVRSVGVDDAYNIWLLDGDRIGVLRPGTDKPVWVKGLGQAAPGFGRELLATGSTVICGGAKNRAYVGYATYDLTQPHREDPDDPEFAKGDLDVVQLEDDGAITLVEHLHRSTGTSNPGGGRNMGIRNSIDWHYDEDRTVLTCVKVMRGRDRGEVYTGSNHGVTRIRGLHYNAHRHPVWDVNGSLRLGYTYGLGIAQNGDVLIANDWKIAILPPPEELGDWEFHGKAPWKVDTYNQELNSLEEFDHWRGFQQTTDGAYYLGSRDFGLWRMEETAWVGSANWFRVAGLPTQEINALAATDDGSLFIGTDDQGLWRMGPDKKLEKVTGVSGARVLQLVYDPTVELPMLYVVTSQGLTVIRGH